MTLKIVETDLDENNFYKQDAVDTVEPIEIEGNLGIIRFKKSVKTKAYLLIKPGSGIEAGGSIEAGGYIKTDEGIISLLEGIQAKTVTCLRVAVGFNVTQEKLIEAKVEQGEVLLGKVAEPNPLPPTKYYWHIHHQKLFEPSTEPIENRIAYIKSEKPKNEVEIRLRLLHEVKDVKTLRRAIFANDHETIEALHKKECPDCPWNGNTIFP